MNIHIHAAARLTAATTSRAVEKAIKQKFGYDAKLYKGPGYFYFDDPDDAPMRITLWKEHSVYVNSLNQLTLDQWLGAFESLMNDNKERE